MRDKDAHLMMEGLYKEAGETGPPPGFDPNAAWKSGKAGPVNWFQQGGDNPDKWETSKFTVIGQEIEQYLSSRPEISDEVAAGVLSIIDKYTTSDGRHSR